KQINEKIESFQQKIVLVDDKYFKRTIVSNLSLFSFDKDNIFEREINAYNLMKENNILVPNITNITPTKKTYSIDKIHGYVFSDLLYENNVSYHAMFRIGQILGRVHMIKPTNTTFDASIDKYYKALLEKCLTNSTNS